MINTHYHGDHNGSNSYFSHQAPIFAHENVRKRMSMDQVVRGRTKKASPKKALPVITFTEDMMYHFNGDDVLITHVHDAHTDGDALVYFTKNNVLHMGDAYFQGKFPYIDLDSGGSIDGYIAASEKILMLADDNTKIIPGHRSLSDKKELTSFKNMLVVLRERVQKNIDEGRSLEDVKKNLFEQILKF